MRGGYHCRPCVERESVASEHSRTSAWLIECLDHCYVIAFYSKANRGCKSSKPRANYNRACWAHESLLGSLDLSSCRNSWRSGSTITPAFSIFAFRVPSPPSTSITLFDHRERIFLTSPL